MDLLPKALQPLRDAARAFFHDDVRLVADEGRLRLRIGTPAEPPLPPLPPLPQARAVPPSDEQGLAAMRAQLAEVLDELPELRAQHRQLALFEAALAHAGLQAIERLPVDVLAGALDQLEGLVSNWSAEALACLRSKMAVSVRRRRPHEGGSSMAAATVGGVVTRR